MIGDCSDHGVQVRGMRVQSEEQFGSGAAHWEQAYEEEGGWTIMQPVQTVGCALRQPREGLTVYKVVFERDGTKGGNRRRCPSAPGPASLRPQIHAWHSTCRPVSMPVRNAREWRWLTFPQPFVEVAFPTVE